MTGTQHWIRWNAPCIDWNVARAALLFRWGFIRGEQKIKLKQVFPNTMHGIQHLQQTWDPPIIGFLSTETAALSVVPFFGATLGSHRATIRCGSEKRFRFHHVTSKACVSGRFQAKFLTCYCSSVILLPWVKEQGLAIRFSMCVV